MTQNLLSFKKKGYLTRILRVIRDVELLKYINPEYPENSYEDSLVFHIRFLVIKICFDRY